MDEAARGPAPRWLSWVNFTFPPAPAPSSANTLGRGSSQDLARTLSSRSEAFKCPVGLWAPPAARSDSGFWCRPSFLSRAPTFPLVSRLLDFSGLISSCFSKGSLWGETGVRPKGAPNEEGCGSRGHRCPVEWPFCAAGNGCLSTVF